MPHCCHHLPVASMPFRKPPLALHHPAFRPNDEFRVQIILVAEREIDLFLGLFPNDSEALFDFKSMTNTLRDGATETFAKQLLFVGSRKKIHRRGKWPRGGLKRVSHGERG